MQGRERITFTLDEQGNPLQVDDDSGRQDTYHWENGDLVRVTDLRGYDWRYEYQRFPGIGEEKVLAARSDPLDRRIAFEHQVLGGGGVCVAGAGLQWSYDQAAQRWISSYASCTRTAVSPPTLALVAIDDDSGTRKRHAYFYDSDAKTYTRTSIDANGVRTDKTLDLNGELVEERRNGRLLRQVRGNGVRSFLVTNQQTAFFSAGKRGQPGMALKISATA